ncbi:mitochondrial adenyl nucleotide antiporter SLC25A24-like [Lycorma delicatula]|uniref:mitochondrial adenyl nucleotide antiporter SLC25A24-like n=1 Tax=Lycorma delicatula TaxID=130591 RepID=UPI003F50FAED
MPMDPDINIHTIEQKTGRWWRLMIAGGIAGAISRTSTAPLERIKIYLQVFGKTTKTTSILAISKHMIKEGGIRSLWRSNGINVLRIAPDTAVRFTTYEQAKQFIVKKHNTEKTIDEPFTPISMGERFIAGSVAGSISQSVTFPLDLLKTRLALGKTNEYRGIVDVAKQVYIKKGITGFYRGYLPNMLGIIPYAGINLAVYETLKAFYQDKYGGNISSLVLLGCGAVGSTCALIFCYPLSLLRTKMQAESGGSKPKMMTIIRQTIVNHGFTGFYHGLTPNLMKVVPSVSIGYAIYETGLKALGVHML